jgi:hypothetical protein
MVSFGVIYKQKGTEVEIRERLCTLLRAVESGQVRLSKERVEMRDSFVATSLLQDTLLSTRYSRESVGLEALAMDVAQDQKLKRWLNSDIDHFAILSVAYQTLLHNKKSKILYTAHDVRTSSAH